MNWKYVLLKKWGENEIEKARGRERASERKKFRLAGKTAAEIGMGR